MKLINRSFTVNADLATGRVRIIQTSGQDELTLTGQEFADLVMLISDLYPNADD